MVSRGKSFLFDYAKIPHIERIERMDGASGPWIPVPSVRSALGCWVKEGWNGLFIFLQDVLLK